MSKIQKQIQEQKQHLREILTEEDVQSLLDLKQELDDTWRKKQIFRTETEMRVSVLNDSRFPTPAAKYWQAVREQNVFFESVMSISFEARRMSVEQKKLERGIQAEEDDLERELLEIELEELFYKRANLELVAKDRIRELKLWSKIKQELNDGSFDTENPNTHQQESLSRILTNRAKTLSPQSTAAEIENILGPLQTLDRLNLDKDSDL